MRDVKFHRGASCAAGWAVLVVRDGRDTYQGRTDTGITLFVQAFANQLRLAGLQSVTNEPPIFDTPKLPLPRDDLGRRKAIGVLEKEMKSKINPRSKPSFVLVLLDSNDSAIYAAIKRIGDVDLGVHTVCMLLEKATNGPKQAQYFANVALKVNAKLGGINHVLDNAAMRWLTTSRTMIVGCDVAHPTDKMALSGAPSVAAVVASVDSTFAQYPGSLNLNPSKIEVSVCVR
jgi:eukaryotic translation initiation factor 2C